MWTGTRRGRSGGGGGGGGVDVVVVVVESKPSTSHHKSFSRSRLRKVSRNGKNKTVNGGGRRGRGGGDTYEMGGAYVRVSCVVCSFILYNFSP